MPKVILRGDATDKSKTYQATFANWESGDIGSASIGNKTISYAGTSASDVASGLATLINASAIPEFKEVIGSSENETLTVSSRTAGKDVIVTFAAENNPDLVGGTITVTEEVKGVAKVGEVQKIELIGNYSGGTWMYTNDFGSGNETTGAIAYDASAATVQTAIEGLASVTAGDVTVTKISADEYELDWDGGNKVGTELAEGSINGGSLTGNGGVEVLETTKGGDKTDAIFSIGLDFIPISASDDFRLKFDDGSDTQVTAALDARTVTAAQLQTALENLSNVGAGNVQVAGGRIASASPVAHHESGFQFYVRFTGALGGTHYLVDALEYWTYPTGSLRNEGRVQDGGGGGFGVYEFQVVDYGIPTAGTFTLTFDFGSGNETTSALAYNASNSAIESAIQALASVGASNKPSVYTTIGAGGVIAIHWQAGTLAGTDIGNPTIDATNLTYTGSLTVSELIKGSSGEDEVQTITVFATGGTLTLTDGTDTTAAIAWNASAATIKSEIESFTAITTVTVTGTGTPADPYIVTYTSPGGTDVANVTGDGTSLTGGGGRVSEKSAHDPGTNEVQELTVDPFATGGTYTLTIDLGSGAETTGNIAWNAAAATIESALEGLASGSAGDFIVTGTNPFLIEFDQNFATTDMALMTGDGTNLNGGHDAQSVTVIVTQRSQGKWHADDPANWEVLEDTDRVPETGDDVFIEDGDQDLRYGLNWLVEFTADAATDRLTTVLPHDFVDGQKVRVTNDVTPTPDPPAGLAVDTDYYVVTVDPNTIQLSATRGGAAIDITDSGTGTHTVAVEFASYTRGSRHTGRVGLSRRNTDGETYYEYRNRKWRFGLLSSGDKQITIGTGDGPGSSRELLFTGKYEIDMVLYRTGGSQEAGVPAFQHEGENANSLVTVYDADAGFAFGAGEVSEYRKIMQHGGFVNLGEGQTTAEYLKTEGEFLSNGATFTGPMTVVG